MKYSIEMPEKQEVVEVLEISPDTDRLMVMPYEVPETQSTEGDLLIDNTEEQGKVNLEKFPLRYGKVLAHGPLVDRYKVGDVVCFHRYSGVDGDMIEHTVLFLRQDDILGGARVRTKPFVAVEKFDDERPTEKMRPLKASPKLKELEDKFGAAQNSEEEAMMRILGKNK